MYILFLKNAHYRKHKVVKKNHRFSYFSISFAIIRFSVSNCSPLRKLISQEHKKSKICFNKVKSPIPLLYVSKHS